MSKELKDLHFKHTLASGREIRLSVHRAANAKPRVMADSVKDFNTEEIREYLVWRERIVATMMASLTPGEVAACASLGWQIIKKRGKGRV